MTRLAAIACLALAAVAVVGPRSDARRVVRMPTIRELCPGGTEWAKVSECIKRQGTTKIVRDEPRLKVVEVEERSRFGGFYIYALGKQWQYKGELRIYEEAELIGFSHVKFGKHTGVRLDVGYASPTSFSVDGETAISALLRQELSLVCFDDEYGCMQVMTACDVLLRGKAYNSFRGELVYADRKLQIVGDRRNAGFYCQSAELLIQDQ